MSSAVLCPPKRVIPGLVPGSISQLSPELRGWMDPATSAGMTARALAYRFNPAESRRVSLYGCLAGGSTAGSAGGARIDPVERGLAPAGMTSTLLAGAGSAIHARP